MKNILLSGIAVLFFMLNVQATKHTINASGTSFNPNNIPNVFVGDTIRWVRINNTHTTTSTTIPAGAAAWNNPLDASNTSFEYPVTVPGVYNYKCIPHESFGMTGSFTASYDCNTLDCDDLDACTVDSCSAQDGCIFFPEDCDDADACTIEDCDVQTGCSNTPINCDDADACTVDSCINGVCQNTVVPCDDADICTTDTCVNGNCMFTPIIGCSNPCDTLTCADSDLCTTDTCTNGACVFTPITCDDADACTTDSCANGTCVFTSIVCDDTDACTTDSCLSGACVFTPLVCNDADSCTTDACVSGVCEFTPILGCNVGINDAGSLMQFSIFPNPMQDKLTIEVAQASLTKIVITDISGKQLLSKQLTGKETLDVSGFKPGVYFIQFTNESKSVVVKLIKE